MTFESWYDKRGKSLSFSMRKIFSFILPIVVIAILGFGYANRTRIREAIDLAQRPSLPTAETYDDVRKTPTSSSNIRVYPGDLPQEGMGDRDAFDMPDVSPSEEGLEEVLPAEKRLAVPFMSQAPHANWDMPYQEACEEASIAMVAGYYRGERDAYSADDADKVILDLVSFETDKMGFGPDMTADETVRTIEAYYPDLFAEVVPVSDVDKIKRLIAKGIPVIIPADGKALPNPNFRNGGPVYHMLVIVGYSNGMFITNDPGTRKGEAFLYEEDDLFSCIHDWNDGDVPNGDRVMIVVRKRG